jgi:hypothetical protein
MKSMFRITARPVSEYYFLLGIYPSSIVYAASASRESLQADPWGRIQAQLALLNSVIGLARGPAELTKETLLVCYPPLHSSKEGQCHGRTLTLLIRITACQHSTRGKLSQIGQRIGRRNTINQIAMTTFELYGTILRTCRVS